ncbi:o-succinylbenzoate synthase [Cyclobacterium marinum]|uniref:o-succinylbenzoate synthase n=1 Tax=Cyclobacterium marinum TaxID=104 RepID=UPI0011ECA0AC|nr:o-succinylbenzoate synthase [Cyclobacterium marinum]MBI0398430.1 o-succinylbenzoate synthase [Cyclobacterium marinum]
MTKLFTVKCSIIAYTLDFKFEAGTSRGILKNKLTHFVQVHSDQFPESIGIGEAGPLKGLSIDDFSDFQEKANLILRRVEQIKFQANQELLLKQIDELQLSEYPSIQFALETALLDLINGGKREIFQNNFFNGNLFLPINGLVWMGDKGFMERQIDQKLEQGFDCIKMKIGAINFDQECEILGKIRDRFSRDKITIRVDANGAFTPENALDRLTKLNEYDIHSIEQPIKPGLFREMNKLCKQSPIPIALDEELIGVYGRGKRLELLESIAPQYIILKPTLLGGIVATREWVELANNTSTGWWMTSALESNIGLNAIAQLTANFQVSIPQGLGTGQLYHNNVDSPLMISEGKLSYNRKFDWELPDIFNH